jgi:O-antigen ligase
MELLATGAVLILALGAIRESARVGASGETAWLSALPRRLTAWARTDPLGAGVVAYLGSALVSTLFSIRPALSLFGAPESLAGLKTAIATASIFFASRSLASNQRWFHIMTSFASVAAAIAAGYALLQLLKLDPYTWGGYATFGGENRVFGTLAHPNMLGAYLVISLPLTARTAMRAPGRLVKMAWMVVGAATLLILITTLSRGAWIGLAVAGTAYVLLAARGVRATTSTSEARPPAPAAGLIWPAALAVLAIALSLLSWPQFRSALLQRISQIGNLSAPTTQSRFQLWNAGLRMGADHPITGVGLDCYGTAFPAYRSAEYVRIEWGGNPTKAHNEMINVFATQGSLGVVAALAVVLLVARAVWRSTASRNPAVRGDAIAAGAALAGFAGQALTGFTVVAVGALAAALAGWLGRAQDAETVRPDPVRSAEGRSRRNWIVGIIVSASATALLVLSVVNPWRAARMEYEASRNPIGNPIRTEGYARAATLLPWYDRYEQEAGRSLLIEAVQSRDRDEAWRTLEQARQAFEHAARIDPRSGILRAYLALVLSSEVRLLPKSEGRARVREVVIGAVTRDPVNPYVIALAEQSLMGAEFDAEARELALRCARLYPDFAQPFADIGSVALRQGRYGDAIDTLAIAVRKDWRGDPQGKAQAWQNLSTAYLKLMKYGDAQAAAERALRLNAALPTASANRLEAIRLRSGGD